MDSRSCMRTHMVVGAHETTRTNGGCRGKRGCRIRRKDCNMAVTCTMTGHTVESSRNHLEQNMQIVTGNIDKHESRERTRAKRCRLCEEDDVICLVEPICRPPQNKTKANRIDMIVALCALFLERTQPPALIYLSVLTDTNRGSFNLNLACSKPFDVDSRVQCN